MAHSLTHGNSPMTYKHTILIIDDEQPTVDSLEILLGNHFNLLIARSRAEALQKLKSTHVDLAFLDITLPDANGFEVLKEIKAHDPSVDVVMLTADERAKSAMRAIEHGAFHYITKPYDKDDIWLVVRRVFEKRSMTREIISLRDDVEQIDHFHNLVGKSPKMQDVYKMIQKVAAADTAVLITGESGTGKELVAKAIHLQSVRKNKYFKAINCGAIPEHLLESELFGYEKGAFTGATERKIGKFEMASGGTLFLDEISAMKDVLQIKLLRVLQEQEIERVGGLKPIPIDVRIIAATNANIRKLIDGGDFRQDLYYRINVIHIHLPPLRERQEDILMLAEHFSKLFSSKFNKPVADFTAAARDVLTDYAWPGNVRELRNVVERAVVLNEGGPIGKEHFPLEMSICRPLAAAELPQSFALKEVVDQYEKQVLLRVLERVHWNQTKAAEVLGIHRNTLLIKLDAFNIQVKQLKQAREDREQNKVLV